MLRINFCGCANGPGVASHKYCLEMCTCAKSRSDGLTPDGIESGHAPGGS